ncbi:unnamed protein product [Orchesella dallaii]|uniref:Uncharacterized protein n=1 Tax=Orchesella dallaii TaxID=48710 RepID=A0ABP1RSG6_9HEXA
MDIPSHFPQWRSLWINPHSLTTQQYPLGQLLLSLAEEVEKEARECEWDWRLQETDQQILIDVSTELSQFLVQTGNAVTEKLPTVTFLFDGHPLQHGPTGQFLLDVACSIADKAQTFCHTRQPLDYKLRIKLRQILFSAADIFETAGRTLLNPVNPHELPENSGGTASDSRPRPPPPLRKNVDMMTEDDGVADQTGTESGNARDRDSREDESSGVEAVLKQTQDTSNLEMNTQTGSENVVESDQNDTNAIIVTPAPPIVSKKTSRSRGRPRKRARTQSNSNDNEEGDPKIGTPFANEAEVTPQQLINADSFRPQAVEADSSLPQAVKTDVSPPIVSSVASTSVGIESRKNVRATARKCSESNSQNTTTTERRYSQRIRRNPV